MYKEMRTRIIPRGPGRYQCPECGQTKRDTEFIVPGRKRMSHWRCAACSKMKQQENYEKKKDEAQRKSWLAIARKYNQSANKIPHIEELSIQLMERFGGITEFTFAWKCQLDHAIVNSPGSKMVLEQFRSIANLIYLTSKNTERQQSVDTMTPEEIDAELLMIGKEIRQRLPDATVIDVQPDSPGPTEGSGGDGSEGSGSRTE